MIGRGERIRTSDPSVPNRVLYQAEPRPDPRDSFYLRAVLETKRFQGADHFERGEIGV
jgi:hypothetical protein